MGRATHQGKVVVGHAHERLCQDGDGRVEVEAAGVELEAGGWTGTGRWGCGRG